MPITVFPHTNPYKFKPLKRNTSICFKVGFRFHLIKLGRYVIVDVGGKCVKFHALNVCILKIKKIIKTPQIVSLCCLCVTTDTAYQQAPPAFLADTALTVYPKFLGGLVFICSCCCSYSSLIHNNDLTFFKPNEIKILNLF